MNTRSVNSAAGVILAALQQKQTAAGIALALESAQMLMSPEIAAELEQLRAEVAALRAERHSTNEALNDAVQALRAGRDRIAELEAELYTEQEQHRTTLEQRNAHARELLGLRGGRAAPYTPGPEAHAQMREGLARYFAGQQAELEDPHDGPLAHKYRLGRDLPKLGGAS